MTTDNLRAAITAALRRRGTIDDIDVTPSLTLLGSRTSTASVVIYGADGAVIDVVARAGDDAKALRGVAFAVGLRDDGSDPAEEVERLRAENKRLLTEVVAWRNGPDGAHALHALLVTRDARDAAAQGFDDLVVKLWRAATGDTHEGPASVEVLLAAVSDLRTDNARLDDATRGALDDLARMRAELAEANAELKAARFIVGSGGVR